MNNTKEHPLDNPAWNAMISGSKPLSLGNDRARFFYDEVGPFAGLKDYHDRSLGDLFELIPPLRVVVIPTVRKFEVPSYWKFIDRVTALQMVFEGPVPPYERHIEPVPLKEVDIPQMLALTELTRPGPFFSRTIEFGNYRGIFSKGQLAAMAGYRMHPFQYREISAVCTHPDHTGNGYGTQLIYDQVSSILGENGIPFLHVRSDNTRAIALYLHLGFAIRTEMNIYVLQKEKSITRLPER